METLTIKKGNAEFHEKFYVTAEYGYAMAYSEPEWDGQYIIVDVYCSDMFPGTLEEWYNYRRNLAELALIENGYAVSTNLGTKVTKKFWDTVKS